MPTVGREPTEDPLVRLQALIRDFIVHRPVTLLVN
jgi:hypothetical protein